MKEKAKHKKNNKVAIRHQPDKDLYCPQLEA